MGYYINTDYKGNSIGKTFSQKIQSLINVGAIKIQPPNKWEEDLCCAVDTGFFGAVGYAFDEQEMRVFLEHDDRPKQWLKVPDAKELVKIKTQNLGGNRYEKDTRGNI